MGTFNTDNIIRANFVDSRFVFNTNDWVIRQAAQYGSSLQFNPVTCEGMHSPMHLFSAGSAAKAGQMVDAIRNGNIGTVAFKDDQGYWVVVPLSSCTIEIFYSNGGLFVAAQGQNGNRMVIQAQGEKTIDNMMGRLASFTKEIG